MQSVVMPAVCVDRGSACFTLPSNPLAFGAPAPIMDMHGLHSYLPHRRYQTGLCDSANL